MANTRFPQIAASDLVVQPLERSETIPSAWYVDPAFDELDQRAVFERTWQYVGPVSRLEQPGDYVSATVAGDPVVVLRDREGTLRAFYNVCRHRGGPLVTSERGSVRMLQCQYHGWTYQLDGMLRGVPRFDRTDLFDRRDYGLVPLEVGVWQGLVFVRISPDGGYDLPVVLDGISETVAPIRLDDMIFDRRVTYDIACNWKVYADNYLEGYHLPIVHPDLCDVLSYADYVTDTFEHYSLQHSPIRNGARDGYARRGPGDDGGMPGDGDPGGIDRGDTRGVDSGDDAADDGRAFYYLVYPNFMLNILPGRLQTNVVLADGPDHCIVHFDYFYSPETLNSRRDNIVADQEFADRVQQEDIDICIHVQRGLRSRGYDRGRFSVDAENGVHHFQSLLKRSYASFLRGQPEEGNERVD